VPLLLLAVLAKGAAETSAPRAKGNRLPDFHGDGRISARRFRGRGLGWSGRSGVDLAQGFLARFARCPAGPRQLLAQGQVVWPGARGLQAFLQFRSLLSHVPILPR
jgi:hypothetical protein